MPFFHRSPQRLLLVEGPDDASLFDGLCRNMAIQGLKIQAVGGASQFRPAIAQVAKQGGLAALGVVRDADDSATSAFQSLKDTLRRNGLPAPDRPQQATTGKPRVAILIMPPEAMGTNRALEDLLYSTIDSPETQALVDAFLSEYEAQGINFRDLDMTKARIHAYLAAHDPPGMSIAEGLRFGLFDLNHPAFNPLRDFLRELMARA